MRSRLLAEGLGSFFLFATVIGFVMSVYFFLLQALVIHAFCQYCLFSAGLSTGLFITAIYVIVKWRHE